MMQEIRAQLASIRAAAILSLPKGWKVLEVKFEISDTDSTCDYDVTLQNSKGEKAVVTGNTPNEVVNGVKNLIFQIYK